eukprot:COSAG02_NODE_2035_length_10040_cov_4.348355_2_plen_107_part_00
MASNDEETCPDSVTTIGDRAFADAVSLESVTLGSGLTSIGDDAFYGTGLMDGMELQAGQTHSVRASVLLVGLPPYVRTRRARTLVQTLAPRLQWMTGTVARSMGSL